ncbi:unnamed protein product [Rotaria sp. Silwood1]|nr:unnamed protein product [Rotaria sp. Silwood1]
MLQQPILQPINTLVLPPISSLPTFSGKSTERPRQFLLRVEEYARTVNNWSNDTLLRGISQFLKDEAFEWYCQLYHTNNKPTDWNQFVVRFLTQFHSPIRAAQQEQAWLDCKQQENETINQFVVRLRSIWLEEKPNEDDSNFTKHLFCKMRPDILTLMNVSRTSSLDSIITEAQQAEEILFLRNKEQRQRDLLKSKPAYYQNHSNTGTPHITYSPLAQSTTLVPPLMDVTTRSRAPPRTQQASSTAYKSSTRNPITCWRCYETGHYAIACPLNNEHQHQSASPSTPYDNYSSQPLPPRTKNI